MLNISISISLVISSASEPKDPLTALFFTNLPVAAQDSIAWFTDNYDIYSDGTTNLNVSSFRHTGLTVYVSQSGNDSNDGLSIGSPKKTVTSALQVAGRKVISVTPGRHYKALPMQTTMPDGISIVCDSGVAEFINSNANDTTNFVADSGVYKCAGVAACYSVWDELNLTSEGYWGFMPVQTSLANLQSAASGWFHSGTDLYVKTVGNRIPDNKLRVITLPEFYYSGTSTTEHTYYENISFLGMMVRPAGGAINVISYFKNTVHAYSGTVVNSNFNNTDCYTYLDGALSHSSYTDLFSLRGFGKSVELNCKAERTLYAGSNNGSTTHTTASAIRLNSLYQNAHGDVIGDISDKSSLMVNCVAKNTFGGIDYGDFRVDANSAGLILVNSSNTGSTSAVGKNSNGNVYQDGSVIAGIAETPAPVYTYMGFSAAPPLNPQLVTNGDFETDVANWTPSGATAVISWDAGRLKLVASAAFTAVDQVITCEVGKTYSISADIEIGTAGAYVQVRSSTSATLASLELDGANSGQFVATTTSITVRLRNATVGTGYFDNISVREI